MNYSPLINSILPLLLKYISDPFELISATKSLNQNGPKYKINFIMNFMADTNKLFKKKLIEKYKFNILSLDCNDDITNDDLVHLHNVHILKLYKNTKITDIGLKFLRNIYKLELFNQYNTNITNAMVDCLVTNQLNELKLFSKVIISNNKRIVQDLASCRTSSCWCGGFNCSNNRMDYFSGPMTSYTYSFNLGYNSYIPNSYMFSSWGDVLTDQVVGRSMRPNYSANQILGGISRKFTNEKITNEIYSKQEAYGKNELETNQKKKHRKKIKIEEQNQNKALKNSQRYNQRNFALRNNYKSANNYRKN